MLTYFDIYFNLWFGPMDNWASRGICKVVAVTKPCPFSGNLSLLGVDESTVYTQFYSRVALLELCNKGLPSGNTLAAWIKRMKEDLLKRDFLSEHQNSEREKGNAFSIKLHQNVVNNTFWFLLLLNICFPSMFPGSHFSGSLLV